MLADVGHIPPGGDPEGKEGTEASGGVGTAGFLADGLGLLGEPVALQGPKGADSAGYPQTLLLYVIRDLKGQHCQECLSN